MKNKWKNLIILALSIALAANGAGNFILSFDSYPYWKYGGPPVSKSFEVGIPEGLLDLDPLNSKDKVSVDVLYQIIEGLYMHNLKDSDLEIVPRLAEDFGNWDLSGTRFTIPLRRNIIFHDGTPFNATAVKWNFERISWFINGTGLLNQTLSPLHSIWKFPNGTFILEPNNPVTINSEYSITLNLKAPFSIIEALLCHTSAYMISSISTSKYEYIHPVYNQIAGTGPFVYEGYYFDYYFEESAFKLHRWENYWREPAYFEDITFTVINDVTTRNDAMLGHRIDYLMGPKSSLLPTFDANPTITLSNDVIGAEYQYLSLKNTLINTTWRQAISYAINYSYVIDDLQEGTCVRAKSPISPAYSGYDPSVKSPIFNLTYARQIVVNMGYGDMSWSDTQWRASNFYSFNFTYKIGNDFREDFLILLQDNLRLIGIRVWDQGLSWFWRPPYDNLNLLYQYMFKSQSYWVSWTPDYFDSMNNYLALFSNQFIPKSWSDYENDFFSNLAFVNDTFLEEKFGDALKETNLNTRLNLYSEIQHYLTEELLPHVFGFHPKLNFVHSADIFDVPYNALNRLYIYPIYRR